MYEHREEATCINTQRKQLVYTHRGRDLCAASLIDVANKRCGLCRITFKQRSKKINLVQGNKTQMFYLEGYRRRKVQGKGGKELIVEMKI